MRTLPYLRAWHDRYAQFGFEILGVHTPKFSFARERAQVETAVGRLGVRWPVVLDNEATIWAAYANRDWPTAYLIDSNGYLRFRHIGEGGYPRVERAIQSALLEDHPQLELPNLLPLVRAEDAPGAACYPTTPELRVDAVGNQRPLASVPLIFTLPPDRRDGSFYLDGMWKAGGDGLILAGETGAIALPYHAASVNAVLSPSPDPVELALHLKPPLAIALEQDGRPIAGDVFGEDVYRDRERTWIRVDTPRMYSLLRNHDVGQHELRINLQGPGLTFYAFSFGSCLVPNGGET